MADVDAEQKRHILKFVDAKIQVTKNIKRCEFQLSSWQVEQAIRDFVVGNFEGVEAEDRFEIDGCVIRVEVTRDA